MKTEVQRIWDGLTKYERPRNTSHFLTVCVCVSVSVSVSVCLSVCRFSLGRISKHFAVESYR
jgi:hypothetical protein